MGESKTMKNLMFLRILSKGQSLFAMCRTGILCAAFVTSHAQTAHAQSFFASNVTDPTAGVDRGSTSGIRKLDTPTTFLTFDTFGSDDIGPTILGFGHVQPNVLTAGDQLDVAGVVAGLSETDGLELSAGGIGYRTHALGADTTAFANFNYSDVTLGSPTGLAFDIKGTLSTAAAGLRLVRQRDEMTSLTSTVEIIGRRATSTSFGAPIINEDLRLLRLSTLYQQGLPFLAQRRFAAAITKGIDGFGASAPTNPLASAPGATSDFLRASFSAEASLPLSDLWIANAGLIGQWSADSLPISQRCGYGTNAYARGFDQGYALGDQCIGTRIELAYNVEDPKVDTRGIRFTQAYFGVDVGRLWNNANLLSPSSSNNWSSGSLGLRTIQGDLIGEAVVTRIFNDPGGTAPQDRTRFWLRAGLRF